MNSLLLQTGITLQLNLPLKISDKGINFLDTTVYKGEIFRNQGILDIHTDFKPTETLQYTHFSFCNPHRVRKGLIKGESLGLPRTNSSANPSMRTSTTSKNAFALKVTLKISQKKSPLRLNLLNRSQLYKRTMKCERNFCLCRTLKTF